MKTKLKKVWMSASVVFLLIAVLIGGCKKDDYVEVIGVCPVVKSTNPANAEVNVPLDQVITATFNEEMDPATINQTSFTLMGGLKSGIAIAGTLTYNSTNATLSFVPTGLLAAGTTYTGTVKSTIKDLKGNALQTNYVWTFSTGTLLSPTVISTDPANLATDVFLNKVVTASFSVAMDPSTITATTFTLQQGANLIAGSVVLNGITASFTSESILTPNTIYTATISTGAKNTEGNPLENNYVWTFTTGSKLGPVVISTDPTNNATGVATDKTVTATFSVPMDPLTITSSTFTMKQGLMTIAGLVTYSGTTASFVPAGSLAANTLYVCTITTGAKNIAGTAISENYIWSFTTGALKAPTVLSTDPAKNAIDVVLNKMVTATFSVPMNPLTMTAATFTVKQGTNAVAGLVSYYGSTISFLPAANYLPGTVYTATITKGATNVAGTPLTEDYVWTFTTGTLKAPTVLSTDPANNAIDVVLNKMITATFSGPMNPLTLTATTFIVKQGTTAVAGLISYYGSTVSFLPAANYLPGTVYTATITTGASNVAGTPLAENYVWTFTTGVLKAPTVVLTDPLNNATGVVLNKMLTATFSEVMDPLTLNAASFTVKNGTASVAGIITYVGKTVSFFPTAAYASNTTYTCTITTGAKNPAGTPLAENYVWIFTSGNIASPTVLSTDPTNNATAVVLTKIITANFSEVMNPLSLTTSSFIIKDGTNTVNGLVSYLGTTATFTPLAALTPGTIYTCTITTGVTNVTGIPMAYDYTWTFTTTVIAAPMVISTDPNDNAIDVPLSKTIAATFNMAMNPLTLTGSSFMLKQGPVAVSGQVTYLGTTAYFNPTNDLLPATTYTVTITTEAQNPAGIGIANDYSWSFTTLAGSVNPNVDLGSAAIFGAFGGNAGVTNQGINTIINGAIASTAASSLITGFHNGLSGDVYTETPLNVGLVTNGIYTAPPFPGTATSFAIATQGLLDATTAYNSTSPASMPGGMDPGAGELGGLTLAPGIYQSASGTFKISNGPLTLDAQGDPNATWVFQTASGLTVGIAGPTGARSIVLINGALPKNVFWHVGTAATINGAGGGIMVGTILAYSGVTFSTAGNAVQTVLNGRAISLVSSVTMVNTTVNVPN